jgi:hypothetical protein
MKRIKIQIQDELNFISNSSKYYEERSLKELIKCYKKTLLLLMNLSKKENRNLMEMLRKLKRGCSNLC